MKKSTIALARSKLHMVILVKTRRSKGKKRLLADFGYIALLLVVCLALPALILALSKFIGHRSKYPQYKEVKEDTYECGMQTIGGTSLQFNFRYYFYALLWVVFDIEAIFLYAWAVNFRELKLFGFIEMLVFIVILVVGLVYAWRKKVLEWK